MTHGRRMPTDLWPRIDHLDVLYPTGVLALALFSFLLGFRLGLFLAR